MSRPTDAVQGGLTDDPYRDLNAAEVAAMPLWQQCCFFIHGWNVSGAKDCATVDGWASLFGEHLREDHERLMRFCCDQIALSANAGSQQSEPVAWWRWSYVDGEGNADAGVQMGKNKPTESVLPSNGYDWFPLYGEPLATPKEAGSQQRAEELATLGWQAIKCPVCGNGARAFSLPKEPTAARAMPTREKLIDLIAEHLSGTYHCTRVWSAWGVGTMSENDFQDVGESDTPTELADAILALAAPADGKAP